MQTDAIGMNRVAEGLPTTSAKIRALAAAGYKRADIARFLNKRYQHVRNVLVQGPPKSELAQGPSAKPGEPGGVESRKLHIAVDGRIVIPAEMRSAMLIDESGYLTVRVAEGELRAIAPKAALYKLQRMVREKVPEGLSLVDELIAERRAEARGEDAQ